MKSKPIIFLVLFVVLCVFWRWFLAFPHVANDLHVAHPSELLNQFALPSMWGSEGAVGLGESSIYVVWNWPVEVLFGTLGHFGIPHNLLNQFFALFLGLLVGFFGMIRLFKKYNLNLTAQCLGSLFYLTTTYLILLVDGGQLSIALAYLYMPLAYVLLKEAVNGGVSKRIIAAFTVALVGVFDIRFIYILALLTIATALYEVIFLESGKKLQLIFKWLTLAVFIGLITILLNAYWVLPAFFSRGQILPSTYSRVSQTAFLDFTSLRHSLLLLQPHWYLNVFGKVTDLRLEFVLIPLLVFLAAFFARKHKSVWFWIAIALVSVFLAKGATEPLPKLYELLFTYLPGFNLFRDSTKFFILVSLSYSVLIGFTFDGVFEKLQKVKIKNNFLKSYFLNPKFFAAMFIIYCLFLVRPVWTGKMTGTFSPPANQDEFEKINSLIGADDTFGRVFWIPTKAPLGYSSSAHPSVEAARFANKRPFAIGTVGTYEVFNYLRESSYMGELFDIAGIKYIVYPYPDTRREELKKDNVDYYYAFLEQISSLPWIEKQLTDPPVPLLKIKSAQDHIFIAQDTFIVVGSDRIYNELMEIKDFELAKNAIVFAEENPETIGEVIGHPNINIILFEKDETALKAAVIPEEYFIFPSSQLEFSPSTKKESLGWWKRETVDYLWWRNFLQQKYGLDNQDFDYGGGWAISEGGGTLTISNNFSTEGNTLLARVMKSGRGGIITFWQCSELIGTVDTRLETPQQVEIKLTGYADIPDQLSVFDDANFEWFEVGTLPEDCPTISVTTEGDINVVNSLVVIPSEKYSEINNILASYNTIEWENINELQKQELFQPKTNQDVIINYSKLSPTHYTVKVEGIGDPITLAFSETYDSSWQINGQGAYPLYSLINGFGVENDGEYDIYYSPQKYVIWGLAVSVLTLLGSVAYLIINRKRSNRV